MSMSGPETQDNAPKTELTEQEKQQQINQINADTEERRRQRQLQEPLRQPLGDETTVSSDDMNELTDEEEKEEKQAEQTDVVQVAIPNAPFSEAVKENFRQTFGDRVSEDLSGHMFIGVPVVTNVTEAQTEAEKLIADILKASGQKDGTGLAITLHNVKEPLASALKEVAAKNGFGIKDPAAQSSISVTPLEVSEPVLPSSPIPTAPKPPVSTNPFDEDVEEEAVQKARLSTVAEPKPPVSTNPFDEDSEKYGTITVKSVRNSADLKRLPSIEGLEITCDPASKNLTIHLLKKPTPENSSKLAKEIIDVIVLAHGEKPGDQSAGSALTTTCSDVHPELLSAMKTESAKTTMPKFIVKETTVIKNDTKPELNESNLITAPARSSFGQK